MTGGFALIYVFALIKGNGARLLLFPKNLCP